MRALGYILFAIVGFGIFWVFGLFMPHHGVTEEAATADRLIGNSRLYAKEHAYERSLAHLDMAIKKISQIEQSLDEDSQELIDQALADLRIIHDEIKFGEIVEEDMNEAYAKALNALTYAELKVTEHFIESDQFNDAMVALKYGMIHIQNALRFIDSDHKNYELKIYAEIDSLMHHSDLPKEKIIAELEKMLSEINELVEDTHL